MEKLRDYAKTHMDLNMCMLGARGVGKTSVMTAIFDDTRSSNGLARTKLVMSAKSETRDYLEQKKDELQSVFDDKVELTNAGIAPSSAANEFNFEIGLWGKKPCIDFTVTDFPGEFIKNNTSFVNEVIKKSSAIFIAIDTPYLMEENGRYNEEKNQVSLIYNFLKENIDEVKEKLILLVPLKCEVYFHSGRMDEVNKKVRKTYQNVIELFDNKSNVVIAITPILTMGDVIFDRFEYKDGFHVAHYKFRTNNAEFTPMFCVQPIYYLLSFVIGQYNRYRDNVNFLQKLVQLTMDFFDKNQEVFEESKALEKYRLKDSNGYSIELNKSLLY